VRLEGLGQLKNSMTSSGFETATCQLVAQCLNQLRYKLNLQYPTQVPRSTESSELRGIEISIAYMILNYCGQENGVFLSKIRV
jgi:hypothetical protein